MISAVASGYNYQWVKCDNSNALIIGANSQTFIPTVPGNYAVIISENDCSDTSDCSAIIFTGINNGAFDQPQLFIYPNPIAGNIVFFETDDAIAVEVLNPLRQIIFEDSFGSGKHQVNLGDMRAGVYSVRATSLLGQKTVKLVKYE